MLALQGAELLLFPTAIGTEPPPALPINSREHWQRTQQGHAAANLMPLIASNRYGEERSLQDPEGLFIRFYGSSFIADPFGAKVEEAGESGDAVLIHRFDLERYGGAARQLVRVPRSPAGSLRSVARPRRTLTRAARPRADPLRLSRKHLPFTDGGGRVCGGSPRPKRPTSR